MTATQSPQFLITAGGERGGIYIGQGEKNLLSRNGLLNTQLSGLDLELLTECRVTHHPLPLPPTLFTICHCIRIFSIIIISIINFQRNYKDKICNIK